MENPTVEAPMASSSDHTQIVKRKRTKRQRVQLAITSSSSGGEDQLLYSQFSESTEEEEDMANCLIMLAESGGRAEFHLEQGRGDKLISNAKRASEKTMKSGIYVYECKTCSRCFPSFQALGGHRASHKKPKATAEAKLMTVMMMENNKDGGISSKTFSLLQQQQLVKNNDKIRVHECSICGSEFSSGQALGGHMRRHRVIREIQEMKKPRNLLALDLNLPAPEDDLDSYNEFQTGFIDGFTRKQPLVFSVASLVDCHY